MLHSFPKDMELSPYCAAALGNEKHWCVQDLIRSDLRAVSPVQDILLSGHQITEKETWILNITVSNMTISSSCAKKPKCTAKKALPKYSSCLEVNCSLLCLKKKQQQQINKFKKRVLQ